MKWLKKLVIKMLWPRLQKIALNYVKSEEYQNKAVQYVNDKVDIPGKNEEEEKKLFDQVYDACQEGLTSTIKNIDIEKILEKYL